MVSIELVQEGVCRFFNQGELFGDFLRIRGYWRQIWKVTEIGREGLRPNERSREDQMWWSLIADGFI